MSICIPICARMSLCIPVCAPMRLMRVRMQWLFAGGALRNVGAALCVDSSGPSDPATVLPCVAGKGMRSRVRSRAYLNELVHAAASQAWSLLPSGHIASGGTCLDVYDFTGPDVETYVRAFACTFPRMGTPCDACEPVCATCRYGCKAAGDEDSNQVWLAAPAPGGAVALTSNSTGLPHASCLAVRAGPGGGWLQTTTAAGDVSPRARL